MTSRIFPRSTYRYSIRSPSELVRAVRSPPKLPYSYRYPGQPFSTSRASRATTRRPLQSYSNSARRPVRRSVADVGRAPAPSSIQKKGMQTSTAVHWAISSSSSVQVYWMRGWGRVAQWDEASFPPASKSKARPPFVWIVSESTLTQTVPGIGAPSATADTSCAAPVGSTKVAPSKVIWKFQSHSSARGIVGGADFRGSQKRIDGEIDPRQEEVPAGRIHRAARNGDEIGILELRRTARGASWTARPRNRGVAIEEARRRARHLPRIEWRNVRMATFVRDAVGDECGSGRGRRARRFRPRATAADPVRERSAGSGGRMRGSAGRRWTRYASE